MNFKMWVLGLLLFSFFLFSEIKVEKENQIMKIKNKNIEINFNLNPSYGTAEIKLKGKELIKLVPGFVKLYPAVEKGKYRTENYWIPTGAQKLEYKIKKNDKDVEFIIIRDFPDFLVRDYFIIEDESGVITYITESEKKKTDFSFEYTNFFNFDKSIGKFIWDKNEVLSENLGDYWQKFIEIKDKRWLSGYNEKEKYGVIIIRDYNFDPEPAWHHYRLFGGPSLGVKITHTDFLTRRQFRIIPFEDITPEEILKKIELGETLPSIYSFSKEKRIYPAFFKEGDIKIDGEIEEDIWKGLRKETNFYKFDWNKTNPYLASQQTEFSAFYDKENIYFSVKCYEEMIKNLRVEQKTGVHVWKDDCIEIFIKPSGSDYFQFAVNPLGERYDNKGLFDKWKAGGKIFDNYWQVEVAIPFSILGKYPKDGEIWGFNICRERRPENELSSWNETSGSAGFHQIDKFGQLIFSPKLTPVKVTLFEAKETIGLISEIINFDGKINEPLRISLSIPDNKAIEKIYPINLDKNERDIISFFKKGDIEKGYNLSFDITSKTGIPFYTNIFEKTGYTGLVSRLWPLSYGNKLYLKQDTSQIFIFLFGNYTEKPQKFSLILEVPEEIKLLFLDRNYNFSYGQFFPLEELKQESLVKDNINYVRYKLKFSKEISPRKLPSQEEERNYDRVILPFYFGKTNLKSFNIYFYLESEDGRLKEKENIYNVDVLPPLKAKLPKKIETGVFSWWFGVIQDSVKDKDRKEAALKTASSFKDAGLNLIVYSAYNKEIKEVLNKEGIRLRPSFWWFWWDEEWLKGHLEDYAINFEGKKAKYGGIDTVCPMVLIENEKAFENTKKIVQKRVTENGNDIFHDTEGPYSWEICFCDRCIKEFKKRYNIPESEKLGPKEIKLKYKNQWLEFADWQQAVIFSKINKAIKEVNPDAKFANYGGLYEPEHRCNWEMLSEYKAIDIAGPSMYELSPATLKYWEEELGKFKMRVKNLPLNVWLNNEARQTNYKLLRTQALKAITVGCQGYSIYYGQLLLEDGRRLYDLGIINTIISDFEDFFVNGKKIEGEIFIDKNKDNYSIDGWELGDEKVIFIFNHDDKNKKEINFILPFKLSKNDVIYDYLKKVKIEKRNEISVILDKLGIGVIYIGSDNKLKEREKFWNNKPLNFLQ